MPYQRLLLTAIAVFLFYVHSTAGMHRSSCGVPFLNHSFQDKTRLSVRMKQPQSPFQRKPVRPSGWSKPNALLLCVSDVSSTTACPNDEPNCRLVLPAADTKPSRGGVRRLFFLFLGCVLTTCLIIAMIFAYRRVTEQRRHPSSGAATGPQHLRNVLQTLGLGNLKISNRFPFLSMSTDSTNAHASATHRQGGTSRAHLHENQDEALLFDDPYAEGGISGGLHGSSANPYKSLTLSVA